MAGSEDTAATDVVFSLTAICASVTGSQLLADDELAGVLVDYGCWERHLRDWHTRRPAVWRRRETRQWRAEGADLSRQRHEIFWRARTCGLLD